MAKEQWTVFYELEDAGAQQPANWKETEIVVEGKEKNSGILAASQTVRAENSSKNLEATPFKKNTPTQARFVTIEAESGAEAAKAVRAFYGQGVVDTKCLAVASTNLKEETLNP